MNVSILLNGAKRFQVSVPLKTALVNKTVEEGSIISRKYLKFGRMEREDIGRLILRKTNGNKTLRFPTWRFVPFNWQGKEHRIFSTDLIGIPTGHEISLVKRAVEWKAAPVQEEALEPLEEQEDEIDFDDDDADEMDED